MTPEQRAAYMRAAGLAQVPTVGAALQYIRAVDAARQHTEDMRSRRRNRNRLFVLVVGVIMATAYPVLMTITNWTFALRWTTVLAFLAEMCETSYAYFRRY